MYTGNYLLEQRKRIMYCYEILEEEYGMKISKEFFYAFTEGYRKGIIANLHDNIISVLLPINEVPNSTQLKIYKQRDIDILNDWFIKAVNSNSIEEFEKYIK